MAPPCSSALVLPCLLVIAMAALQSAVVFADTVTAKRPLSGSQSALVSKRRKFALGFFQPENSQHWYLGIWYNQISKHTPVWVANRGTPISNPDTSQLTIATDGNMVLLDNSTTAIWSTNISKIASNSTVGVILDTGNLVLADASNTSIIHWQSFDHFGNTWLPGGKLGRNNKLAGVSTRLVAWKARNDPSPGVFSLELDPNGTSQYLLEWSITQQYWTSGNWTGRIFADVPEMTGCYPSSTYTFDYVNGENESESYFVYDLKDESVLTRFFLSEMGQIQFLTWIYAAKDWMPFWSQPKVKCDVYSLCGPFSVCTENALTSCSCLRGFSEQNVGEWLQGDHTSGCRRNVELQCSSNASVMGRTDGFYTMANVRLPSNAESVVVIGNDQCEQACLRSCSCTAYSYNGSCSLWHGDLINLQDVSAISSQGSSTVLIRLAASELSGQKQKNTKNLITIAIVATSVLVLMIAALFFIFRRRMVKQTTRVEGSLIAFTYRDLKSVTKNFSEKLGGGAFGLVFKGSLPDATVVAVKKLEGFRQGEKQFRAEVSTIGNIQHVNLIRLLGFCSEKSRRLLVYEYMPNGSLDKQLFDNKKHVLSWNTRYQIALGIARGLDYLHEKCRDCIIHCDIKPENILLDGSFAPKVADFGLAKLMGRDISRVLTTARGTVGYIAPEWIAGTAVTAKADVFSYGMTLLEIVSGRRNVQGRRRRQEQQDDGGAAADRPFPLVAAGRLVGGGVGGGRREELVSAVVDCRLGGDADMGEVERACRVACWCIQDDENARPAMATVVQVLEGLVEIGVPPIPRSLQFLAELADQSNYLQFFSDLLPSN
ncbi:G-type lectin S-receptor-like serine/threonine-protein kinase At2g19130 [Oryza glaberrima]|uniref:Receptor-like serine/threonine-protein kinase n=1 Tax=Oryza glaberrima TaxID=4538 RepID=I1NTS0_ORYGL|nr:G-type lectin S-receptor-like serine/threonine-protein kinase At2g19130 [Oryza glaberrima]